MAIVTIKDASPDTTVRALLVDGYGSDVSKTDINGRAEFRDTTHWVRIEIWDPQTEKWRRISKKFRPLMGCITCEISPP